MKAKKFLVKFFMVQCLLLLGWQGFLKAGTLDIAVKRLPSAVLIGLHQASIGEVPSTNPPILEASPSNSFHGNGNPELSFLKYEETDEDDKSHSFRKYFPGSKTLTVLWCALWNGYLSQTPKKRSLISEHSYISPNPERYILFEVFRI